jgi:hypothetical protein
MNIVPTISKARTFLFLIKRYRLEVYALAHLRLSLVKRIVVNTVIATMTALVSVSKTIVGFPLCFTAMPTNAQIMTNA